jgi:S1-C subfamily serine protease
LRRRPAAGEWRDLRLKAPGAALRPLQLFLRMLAFGHRHLGLLLAGVALLTVALGGLGIHFYRTLQDTRHQLAANQLRLYDAVERNLQSEQRIGMALLTLKQERSAVNHQLANALQRGLTDLQTRTDEHLSSLISRNGADNSRQSEEVRVQMDSMRSEMMSEYERLRSQGEALIASLSSRAEAVRGNGAAFKSAFIQASKAILYIRTEYRVRLKLTGEERNLIGFGTGFFISPSGIALSAQHVIYPWRYEKILRASLEAGMVELIPGTHTVTVWMANQRVLTGDDSARSFLPQNAYQMGSHRRELSLLYSGDRHETLESVATPMGTYNLKMPRLVLGDVVVLQVHDERRRFPHLTLAPAKVSLAPLDEVMVVGYPLSRLQNGVAIPQPSRGRVRRMSDGMVELDSPLHPGNSGGPILDRQGRVIGLASAILDSPVYGVAVPVRELHEAWNEVRRQVRAEQLQLKALGCDPGAIDGIPGSRTQQARRCGAARSAK